MTLVMTHHWQINLLQHHLILSSSSELILAPASGETGCAIKHFISSWQTSSVQMLIQNKVLGDEENSEVILQVATIKLWMNGEVLYVSVLMRIRF